jgi:hypothetical protein
MTNIKEYDKNLFHQLFDNSVICKQICEEFDNINWETNFNTKPVIKDLANRAEEYKEIIDDFYYNELTTRQIIGEKISEKWFSVIPLYYISFLLEKNPKKIYDFGCGWNIFKKYISNIVGIDFKNKHFYADELDFIDKDYIFNHAESFESFFSICTFDDTPIEDIKVLINDQLSMLKKNGRAFLSLNAEKLINASKTMKNKDTIEYENFLRQEITSINMNILCLDINLIPLSNSLDGNVRIVFEKI